MKLGNFLKPHSGLSTLCQGAAVLALALAPVAAQANPYSKGYDRHYSGSSHHHDISALNYRTCSALKANQTYTGVVVNVQPVKVTSYRPGIVPLLFTGVVDAVGGTRLSEVHQDANQYTVRLDTPRQPNKFQFVTVIQGPGNPMQPGSPVLMVTEQMRNGHAEVRLSPFHNPNMVRVAGATEFGSREMAARDMDYTKAREADMREFRRQEAVKDAVNQKLINDIKTGKVTVVRAPQDPSMP